LVGGGVELLSKVIIHNSEAHPVASAVSCQPLMREAQFQSQTNLCGIYGGESDIGTGFSPSSSVFPKFFGFLWSL